VDINAALCAFQLNKYGQPELDMRRKAEVLLYKNNSSKLTKKEQFAYFAKRPKPPKFPNIKPSCTKETIYYNPSSASDVPGNKLLYNDMSVPLTNYKPRRTYKGGGGVNIPVNQYIIPPVS